MIFALLLNSFDQFIGSFLLCENRFRFPLKLLSQQFKFAELFSVIFFDSSDITESEKSQDADQGETPCNELIYGLKVSGIGFFQQVFLDAII